MVKRNRQVAIAPTVTVEPKPIAKLSPNVIYANRRTEVEQFWTNLQNGVRKIFEMKEFSIGEYMEMYR